MDERQSIAPEGQARDTTHAGPEPSADAWAFLILTLPHTRMEFMHDRFTASPLLKANFYSDEKKGNKSKPPGRPAKYSS